MIPYPRDTMTKYARIEPGTPTCAGTIDHQSTQTVGCLTHILSLLQYESHYTLRKSTVLT